MRLEPTRHRLGPPVDITSVEFTWIAGGWLAAVAIVLVVSLALRHFA